MIKAVFVDFDYTIYSHKTKGIPESAAKALKALHEKGIKLFLATGRNQTEMTLFPEVFDIFFDGFIMLNGQLCMDENYKKMFGTPIEGVSKEALLKLFNEKKQPMVFVEETDVYINYNDPVVEIANGEIACLKHEERPYSGKPLYLAVCYITKEQEPELLAKLPGCCFKRWSENGVDIVNENSDKAKAIERLIGMLGISKEECMAIGDSYNDKDMLEFVGTSVAMGNAIQELKDIADFVTTDIDDDGLLNAFKHYSLL